LKVLIFSAQSASVELAVVEGRNFSISLSECLFWMAAGGCDSCKLVVRDKRDGTENKCPSTDVSVFACVWNVFFQQNLLLARALCEFTFLCVNSFWFRLFFLFCFVFVSLRNAFYDRRDLPGLLNTSFRMFSFPGQMRSQKCDFCNNWDDTLTQVSSGDDLSAMLRIFPNARPFDPESVLYVCQSCRTKPQKLPPPTLDPNFMTELPPDSRFSGCSVESVVKALSDNCPAMFEAFDACTSQEMRRKVLSEFASSFGRGWKKKAAVDAPKKGA
jgi:hypothetical protein